MLLSFRVRGRSLVRDAYIEEEGTITVYTTRGAHLTADIVIEVLVEREPPKPRHKDDARSGRTRTIYNVNTG